MAPELPDDVLYIICYELRQIKDFHTLFCCAVSSKRFAEPALSNLYRIQDVAPVTSGGLDDAPGKTDQDATTRWMAMWRSLISSTLRKTAYPYCRYIRVLDLEDLSQLLDDTRFVREYAQQFFQGDLAPFFVEYDFASGRGTRAKRQRRFNTKATVHKVGEILTEHTPMVQELSGNIDSSDLGRWVPRLKHLQRLRLWDGLNVDGIAPLLCEHCPNFKALMMFNATSPSADSTLSGFIKALNQNTFESFIIAGSIHAHDHIFTAFNHHATSLTTLKLECIPDEALLHISQMSSCTALQSLHIASTGLIHANIDTDTYIPKIVAWLRSCKSLNDLSLHSRDHVRDVFPKLLAPVLRESDIHISKLSVSNYNPSQAAEFHRALANQAPSLRSLFLKADGETCDAEPLVDSLGHLHGLLDLRLQSISDYFRNRHVIGLAENLHNLEELWISGWEINDNVLVFLSNIRSLRRLEINAYSEFTFEGVLDFINQLDSSQRGFSLAINLANPSTELSRNEEGQTLLRETMESKLDGWFEYTAGRDPNAAEFGDSSEDSD